MKALKNLILALTLFAGVAGPFVAHADDSDPAAVVAPSVPDFVLFSLVKVKPGTVVDFTATVLVYAAQTRLEPGCLEYRVHQSPDDPTQFETYEHWASDAARTAHLAAPYTVEFFRTVGPLFESGYPLRQKMIELR